MKTFEKCSRTVNPDLFEVNPDLFSEAVKMIYAVEDPYKNVCQDFHPYITRIHT